MSTSDDMRRAYQRLAANFAGGALTLPQTAVLRALLGGGPMNQTRLVEASGIDRSTLGEMLRRLASAGHVVAARAEGDKRANLVLLTPGGRTTLWKAEKALAAAEADLVAAIPAADRKPFLRALRALAEASPVG